MVAIPIYTSMTYLNVKIMTQDKIFPGMILDNLKHPIFQTAYLNPETD